MKTILLVDEDDPDALRNVFENRGFQVVVADGSDVLPFLEAGVADVVILDAHLSACGGAEGLGILLSIKHVDRSIPVVLHCDYAVEPFDWRPSFADAYVPHHSGVRSLVQAVEGCLARFEGTNAKVT